MGFDTVIGLEIHLQLKTKSKMFCACPSGAKTDMAPNTAICPLCSGQPGALPVLNKEAVELAAKAGLVFNAQINETSTFARKNYFYPDLPKGYQITQDDKPIITDGYLETLVGEDTTKKIKIVRAHLEEDAGKSMHGDGCSLVDLNRSGVPLLEIVSAPDLTNVGQAISYLKTLRHMMQWFGISDCDMEKGELRVDINLSLKPEGAKKLGTRVEIKNLNSWGAAYLALQYEIKRQSDILSAGGVIEQQTMLWNEKSSRTEPMRSKETAQEYRYFPEPDLPPLVLEAGLLESIKSKMPDTPGVKKQFYMQQYGLDDYDANFLTSFREVSEYFDAAVAAGATPKTANNWIGTDILAKLSSSRDYAICKFSPQELAALIKYIESGKISGKMAKEIFARAWDEGKSVKEIVESSGASQISDEEQLEAWALQAIVDNPKAAADVKAGNTKAIGALVGSVMKKSAGKANPAALNKILHRLIQAL